jgi:O-antigen ligase
MFALLVPILFLSVGWFAHEPVSLFSSSVLFILVFLTIALVKKLNWRRSNLFFLALSLPFVYLISAIVNSQSPVSLFLGGYQRNYGLATILALSLLFILSASMKLDLGKFLNYGLISTLVLANSYGYLQYFDLDPLPWTNPFDAVSLTLGNPNFSGALFGMLSVVVFGKLITTRTITFNLAYLLLLLSTIFLGFQTKSLQSQLLLISSILVFLFVYSLGQVSRIYTLIRYSSLALFSTGIVGLISIFGFSGFSQLRERIFFQGSIPQRLNYWQNGINIWQDNLLFGVGADQFQRYAAIYRTPEQIVRDGNMVIPDKSHNVLIDHLANGGIFAGLIWLTFVIAIYFVLFKTIKESLKNRVEISILAGIWSAYVIQSLISPDQILLSVIGYSSAGLIVGSYLSKQEVLMGSKVLEKENPYFVKVSAGLVLVISLAIFGRALAANADARDMLDGKLVGAQSFLEVLDAWPNPKVTELIGIELAKDPNNCRLTNDVADRLIKIDDRSSQGWFMKVVCANANREFIKAIEYVDNSLKFDPSNPFYLISKAKLEIAANQLGNAAKTVAKVKSIKPNESDIALLESSIANLKK